MELPMWVVIRYLIEILLLPGIGFMVWTAKRIITRVDKVEQRVSELDKHVAVHQSIIEDIRSDIRVIDRKLDHIVTLLCNMHGEK